MNSTRKIHLPAAQNTVYLVDSSIYIYRAWHLTPKSVHDIHSNPVNALHGFATFLQQLLMQTQAQFLLCAFDHESRPTRRQQIYPPYKASRRATPDHLRPQFALCQQLLGLLGIPYLSVPMYEADDIIDTMARISRPHGKQTCIISADKDLTQCLQAGDIYWNFAKNIKQDSHSIEKRFGVKPSQMADLLALSGDKVDSIPGVPGVGIATAARLLKKWGNIDMLFAHLDKAAKMKFRGAAIIAEELQAHEAQVRAARQISGLFYIKELEGQTTRIAPQPIDGVALQQFLDCNGFDKSQQQDLLNARNAM